MAQHWSEGVGTLRFTSREYQQELIEIGCKDNLLTCPPEQAANFVALKLLQEMAHQIRPPSRMKSVFLTQPRKVKSLVAELRQLTDLHVTSVSSHNKHCTLNEGEHLEQNSKMIFERNQVLIVTSSVLDEMLSNGEIEMSSINLLIIDECHSVMSDKHLQRIMSVYSKQKESESDSEKIPRIIAFSYPLFNQNCTFDENITDGTVKNIQKDYDDFINNRSEFYNEWDCDDLKSESLVKSANQSNTSTPVKSGQSSNLNTPIKKDKIESKNVPHTSDLINYDSLNHVFTCDEEKDENYQKMTDFNYWRMDFIDLDIPETKKKQERLSIYDKLEYQLEKLEEMLCAKADMAADIVGLKKITGKPREVLLESADPNIDDYLCEKGKVLKHYMKRTVFNGLVFIDDHRYDPLEIYGDDAFGDELRAIPNPVLEPRELLNQFLHVLDQAGPYAADKAAFILLVKIEKLKVKIPYERHFLLLCLVTSVFLQIRSAAEMVFEKYATETEKIIKFTSPKVLKLMDIFKLFKPKIPHNAEVVITDDKKGINMDESSKSNEVTDKLQSEMLDDNGIKQENNDFTKNIIMDDDSIKVYVEATITNNKDGVGVGLSDVNSSQNSDSDALDLVDIKSVGNEQRTDLIEQIDSCDFQLLQSKLQKQCNQFNNDRNTNSLNDEHSPQTVTDIKHNNGCDNEPNAESILLKATQIVDDLISSADVVLNVRNAQSKFQDEDKCDGDNKDVKIENKDDEMDNKCDEIDNKCVETDDKKNCEEPKKVVDDVCYTKGAFETLLQTNAKNKDETPSGNDKCNLLERQKNYKLENNQDYLINGENVKPNADLGSYKSSPRRRHNDGGKKGRKGDNRSHHWNDPDALCALIFVDEPLMAKILYTLIYEYSRHDSELQFINAQFTVDKTADPQLEPKEAENEHKLQEEVLRRFRTHECNLLIGTSVLEDGMDLPKCNLVIRWDPPRGYRCYAQCRSRARAPKSLYALMAPEHPEKLVTALAQFAHIERMLVRKCRWSEPGPMEEARASDFTPLILPYRPEQQAVTLSQAVQLLNRYCAKLPSDTFTRLVPLWSIEEVVYKGCTLYICSVRLPINSPLKYQIVGHPMPTKVLARRIAALQVCRALHLSGELDNHLLPIGKESFRALEPDWMNVLPAYDNALSNADAHNEPRPGTTKRKQYYYKKIAKSLTGCRPVLGRPCLAYEIRAHLAVPLPERHNTRGRKLHPPENYAQGFCILSSKPLHQIPVFPLFTRSGEVRIELVKMPVKVVMNKRRNKLIHRFMKYTFKEVLRVHNHLMVFNPGKGKKNNYYIVPTNKVTNQDGSPNVVVDWEFLELIYNHTEVNKNIMLLNENTIGDLKVNQKEQLDEKQSAVEPSLVCSSVDEEVIDKSVMDVQRDIHEKSDINGEGISNGKSVSESDEAGSKQKIDEPDNLVENMNEDVDKCSENNKQNDKTEEIDEPATKGDVNVNVNDGKLVKLEDLGEDMMEDTWKGQENKVSSVKWDEFDENDTSNKHEKKSDDTPVVEEPEEMPNPYLAPGEIFQFDYEKYRDAVVTPWYRNQNQPQYFYVAEICRHLTPLSAFPSSVHPSFMDYYHTKYGVTITQIKQPLLDVDHTSARLNLLTPRFVNRKGVALPTSSERTKRAKRELLEQKQILVPELCCTHPFRGALWRAAVTLPCVLYRINSLLLADEIRRSVATRVSLGKAYPHPNFSWPPLDFGWSLADVLKEKTDSTQQKDAISSLEEDKNQIENSTADAEDKKTDDVENDGSKKSDSGNEEGRDESLSEDVEKDKTANEIIMEKEKLNENGDMFEVGTWSNEMASSMPPVSDIEDDVFSKLPGNVTMCNNMDDADWNASISTKYPSNMFSHTQNRKYSVADSDNSYISSDMDVSGDETNTDDDDDELDDVNHKENEKGGIRIEFKSGNEAEAIDVPPPVEDLEPEDQDDLEARRVEEEISKDTFNNFFYAEDTGENDKEMKEYIQEYEMAIKTNEKDILKNGTLIKYRDPLSNIKLNDYSENIPFHTPKHDTFRHINKRIDYLVHSLRNNATKYLENTQTTDKQIENHQSNTKSDVDLFKNDEDHTNPFPDIYEKALSKEEIIKLFKEMFPYEKTPSDKDFNGTSMGESILKGGSIHLEDLENNKRKILNEIKSSMPKEQWRKYNFFAMKDFHHDDTFESDYEDVRLKRIEQQANDCVLSDKSSNEVMVEPEKTFSFDYQPDLKTHPGPTPSIILQALTMSNANDGINLERLETVGDSFLKYAITVYLYCSYPNIHEGKLSYLRSKQVSNLNLYRLGRRRHLGGRMVACKFEPHDNWLPPCHKVPAHLERALIHTHIPSSLWNVADMPSLDKMSREEVEKLVYERVMQQHMKPASENGDELVNSSHDQCPTHGNIIVNECDTTVAQCTCHTAKKADISVDSGKGSDNILEEVPCFVPYNLITQHSIPDKSIADCVEALIGAYLIECGPRGALLFMAWLGIRVLPKHEIVLDNSHPFIKLMEESRIKKRNSQKCGRDKTLNKINEEDLNELNNLQSKQASLVKKKSRRKQKKDKQVNGGNDRSLVTEEKQETDTDVWNSVVKNNEKKGKVRKRKNKHKNKMNIEKEVPKIKEINKEKLCGENIETDSKCTLDIDIDTSCSNENDYVDSDNNIESSDEEEDENASVDSGGEGSDWSEVDSDVEENWCKEEMEPGSLLPYKSKDGQWIQVIFGQLEPPPSPLLRYVPDPDGELMQMLSGYDELERTLNYRFKDRCYLLQAMTHASHAHNRLTDCYQRLEFLGDAVLDYLITRQLYEDPRRHSPGPLTDLRSALVNNTIFASLAVRHGMHKYFRHLSPGLNEVLARFVKIQEENGHSISEEHYLIQEDECEQAEDVEVPKALGDLFESIAGAIFLDSGMSLDAVWKVYYALMHKEMELFSETVPKSPVRELLEMEPETTKFGKPEKLADGRRVRVTVEVLGVGAFKGVGRNFRIAKCTAAKCALRHLNLLRGKSGGVKGSGKSKMSSK